MGITDFFSDILASVGFQEARAEAPAEEEDNKEEGGDESGGEKSEEAVAEEGGEDAGGEKEEEEGGADAEEEEEEEEEDDEPVDPKQSLEAGQSHPPPDHRSAQLWPVQKKSTQYSLRRG